MPQRITPTLVSALPSKKPKKIAPTLVSAPPSRKKTKRNKSGMAAKLHTLAKGKKPQPGGPRGGLSCRRVPGRMITIEKGGKREKIEKKKNKKKKKKAMKNQIGQLPVGGKHGTDAQRLYMKKIKNNLSWAKVQHEQMKGEDANPELAF